jgi:Na+/proline symporter
MDKDTLKIIAGIYSTAVWGFIILNLTGFMQLNQRCLDIAQSSRDIGKIFAIVPFINVLAVFYLPVVLVGAIKWKDKPVVAEKPKAS